VRVVSIGSGVFLLVLVAMLFYPEAKRTAVVSKAGDLRHPANILAQYKARRNLARS
jgi:hypothetical protein